MNQSIEGTVNHFFPIMSFRIIFRHWKNSVPTDASLDLVRYEDTPRFEQIQHKHKIYLYLDKIHFIINYSKRISSE